MPATLIIGAWGFEGGNISVKSVIVPCAVAIHPLEAMFTCVTEGI